MKRIKQINESKELIISALVMLLTEKSYDDITISEIAKVAGVARMTVYRHFDEKEDIILTIFEKNLLKILDLMEKIDDPSLMDLLIFRFKVLKESPYTEILAKHEILKKLSQTVRKGNAHHFQELMFKPGNTRVRTFITGGIRAMTESWIKSGMKETPEYMAGEIVKILNCFQHCSDTL
jgi:AcrR family transcriptional regulator